MCPPVQNVSAKSHRVIRKSLPGLTQVKSSRLKRFNDLTRRRDWSFWSSALLGKLDLSKERTTSYSSVTSQNPTESQWQGAGARTTISHENKYIIGLNRCRF